MPTIAEDLLQNTQDWRNVQDIIRITFKSLTDVIKYHASAIRDLENNMPLKLTKADISALIYTKVDVEELNELRNEIRIKREDTRALDEIRDMIQDRPTRSDLHYSLSTKASVEEVQSISDSCVSARELESTTQTLEIKINELKRDVVSKINYLPTEKDLIGLRDNLRNKLDQTYIDDYLHRWEERHNTSVEQLMNAVECKADIKWVEQIESSMNEKVDRQEISNNLLPLISKKVDRTDIEQIRDHFSDNVRNGMDRILKESDMLKQDFKNLENELEGFLKNVQVTMNKKADLKELDSFAYILESKLDTNAADELMNTLRIEILDNLNAHRIQVSAEVTHCQEFISSGSQRVDEKQNKINADLRTVRDQIQDLLLSCTKEMEDLKNSYRNLYESRYKEFYTSVSNLQQFEEDTKKDIKSLKDTRSEWNSIASEMNSMISKLAAKLNSKADSKGIYESLELYQKDISSSINALNEEMAYRSKDLEREILTQIKFKADKNYVDSLSENKIDKSQCVKLIEAKASEEDIRSMYARLEEMQKEIYNMSSGQDTTLVISRLERTVDDLVKDLLLKASIKDICALLDMKANTEDLNSSIQNIHQQLTLKAESDELAAHIHEQNLINEAICSENTLARWLWKSRDLKSNGIIPWEVERSNTCPENFVWNEGATSILVVTPGLYEISFGFFGRKKPTIQVQVNGEPVLSAVNTASYVIHHSTSKLKSYTGDLNSNVTGLTLVDFLALPPRSRITLCYSGEPGEGFLNLRKL